MQRCLISPVIIYVVAELLNKLRYEMGFWRPMSASLNLHTRWPKIARIRAEAFESLALER